MLSMFRMPRSRRGEPRPWGDGLLEHGLSTLWYPCSWHSVDEDELVLLVPSLLTYRQPLDLADGPAAHLCRRLTARLARSGMHPGSRSAAHGGNEATSELITGSGAISVYLAAGCPAKNEQVARTAPRTAPRCSQLPFNSAFWREELCALATMDRMLYDTLPATAQKAPPLLERPELPDVLLATIHTSVNGAYVYPETGFAHELLTAGAWLGIVLTGRPALMPSTVGEVLLSYLDRSPRGHGLSERRIVRVLEHCCERVGGADRLLRAARGAVGRRCPIFAPRPACRGPDTTSAMVWNPALAMRIDSYLATAGANGCGS